MACRPGVTLLIMARSTNLKTKDKAALSLSTLTRFGSGKELKKREREPTVYTGISWNNTQFYLEGGIIIDEANLNPDTTIKEVCCMFDGLLIPRPL
jgi:hypothetical protein